MHIKKIGKVSHYYNKISVAILDLSAGLAVGDRVKFTRGGEDVAEQTVESMQIDHKEVSKAKKGDTIGLKVNEEIKEGAEVYKV